MGIGARRAPLPLPVDLPGLLLARDPPRAVGRRQPDLPLDGRGPDLGDRQPRPHAQRPDQARAVGRADHARQHRRRGLLHDLRARRVAARARRAVGRLGRRPGPPLARRRPDLAGGHAARAARVGAGQHDRALAARRRPPATSPPPATSSTTRGPTCSRRATTADLDAHHERHARTTSSRASIREDPDRRGLLYAGTETRRVRLVRRRRRLAAAAAEPARSRRSTT